MKIIIGSRESQLALIQSKIVIDAIKSYDSSITTDLVTMKTAGDKILDKALDKVGGKGLFIKELEQALLDRKVDLTVHSLKDVTMEELSEIPILAFSKREDPRDALILPNGISSLDFSKPIGCSSRRRILQLKKIYPQANFEIIRGNIQTRLKKLDSGYFSATVLACAGLKRLGLENRISRIFEPDEILPAAGQGILVVQGRKNFDVTPLKKFNDELSRIIAIAERSFVRHLDGGCTSPTAAYAELFGNTIKLTGFYGDNLGHCLKACVKGSLDEAEKLGKVLATQIKNNLND